jgi:hypothetical protein
MRWTFLSPVAAVLAVSCGHSATGGSSPGSGSGGAGPAVIDPAAQVDPRCAAATPKVEALYRSAAAASEPPARVEEAVRDNVAMVMAECRRHPEVGACAAAAPTVAQLERACLAPLDDEGSEGDALGR